MSDVVKKKRKRRPPAKKPGPKTDLTKELLSEIKDRVILGYTYTKIQQELKIPVSTWCNWAAKNYDNFRDKLNSYDLDYQLSLAKANLKNILKLETKEQVMGMFGPVFDKKTKKPLIKENDKLLKIKSDISVFVTETIGKSDYSKKQPLEDIEDTVMVILKK